MTERQKKKFMKMAIKEGYKGMINHEGGPFGAVIVKDGKVIAKGHNRVLKKNDPTCHGEMMAIRNACKKLGTFDLSGCELFTSGECCTMCLCASLWANIEHVYYACTLEDNAMIGFRDEKFDNIFEGREKNLPGYCEQVCHEEGLKLFKDYLKTNPQNY